MNTPAEDLVMAADDFVNINSMTKVRNFFIDNRLGHLDEALAVARADGGGVYPVGTVIQLVPQEAMVKRRRGWNPATRDWEFFFLDVSSQGTEIVTRGATETVNRFGGNCAACHSLADERFDFVCEDSHGCEPLPVGDDVIAAIQAADPRPLP
jgi:mono/diheme cytochrome c family protein